MSNPAVTSHIEPNLLGVKNHTSNNRDIALLSELMFRGYAGDFSSPLPDLQELRIEELPLNTQRFQKLVNLADTHHVTVRALRVLACVARDGGHEQLEEWCEAALGTEQKRIANAVEWLNAIVRCMQDSGCPVCVIKSLDHWPDLGSDLDLYTSGAPEQVGRIMRQKLQAQEERRSWGDKLANKWNFRVPGLPELVEVHVRYLGQTGEQELMARRVLERSVTKTVNDHSFPVPAPEERILISTLQRMYRHFYFRLCDIADVAALIHSGLLDFAELRRGAELGNIWPGVASFLVIVGEYLRTRGGHVEIPVKVIAAAYARDLRVHFRDSFLRVPMGPAAALYSSQLFAAGRHGDMRAVTRLPLLPPLAVSALLAYRLTGSDKGIW
jgi:Uncharacterised nucleotidyltransferase